MKLQANVKLKKLSQNHQKRASMRVWSKVYEKPLEVIRKDGCCKWGTVGKSASVC